MSSEFLNASTIFAIVTTALHLPAHGSELHHPLPVQTIESRPFQLAQAAPGRMRAPLDSSVIVIPLPPGTPPLGGGDLIDTQRVDDGFTYRGPYGKSRLTRDEHVREVVPSDRAAIPEGFEPKTVPETVTDIGRHVTASEGDGGQSRARRARLQDEIIVETGRAILDDAERNLGRAQGRATDALINLGDRIMQ